MTPSHYHHSSTQRPQKDQVFRHDGTGKTYFVYAAYGPIVTLANVEDPSEMLREMWPQPFFETFTQVTLRAKTSKNPAKV